MHILSKSFNKQQQQKNKFSYSRVLHFKWFFSPMFKENRWRSPSVLASGSQQSNASSSVDPLPGPRIQQVLRKKSLPAGRHRNQFVRQEEPKLSACNTMLPNNFNGWQYRGRWQYRGPLSARGSLGGLTSGRSVSLRPVTLNVAQPPQTRFALVVRRREVAVKCRPPLTVCS